MNPQSEFPRNDDENEGGGEFRPQMSRPDFSQFSSSPSTDGEEPGNVENLGDANNPDMLDLNDIVPADQRGTGEPAINIFLRALTNSGASDLHLNYNVPPVLRLHGRLRPLKFKPLNAATMKKMLYQILDENQRQLCEQAREVDACYDIPGVGRYRMNIYNQLYGLAAVFRAIPVRISTIKEVGLDEKIARLGLYTQGFIVVTGATGSGKSTTLAAMIDYINRKANRHIVTIEDPLEFVHKSQKSLITHREVGTHSRSFADSLRAALRQDPDVILLGELRDLETIEIALTAAETGHLVLGTLHTNNATETISRIISVFPADRQDQAAMQLSTVITAVISQELLVKKGGGGRVAVREIMIGNAAVRAMIRDGKIPQLHSAIEMGKTQGMRTMKESIEEALKNGLISDVVAKEKLEQLKN